MYQKVFFPSVVSLYEYKVYQFHLEITHTVDKHTFQTKVYYPGIDLYALNDQYSHELMEKIYAHIALSETFKFLSLFPERIDLSKISEFISKETLAFFLKTYQHAYAQCMYENQIGNEYQPIIVHDELIEVDGTHFSIKSSENDSDQFHNTILVGNGGGKDSFLAMKLFEKANLSYASYQWTRPEYGRSQYQHQLCSRLLQNANPQDAHKVSVFDDFTDSPFIDIYYPHLKGVFTLGIPECIFEALPIMLSRGYNTLCFANEKSSDNGNLYWEGIKKEVNHQWVKSLEAELCFQSYISKFLLKDFQFFSILKPIYDFRIFQHLSKYPEFIKNAHSCNIDKPWCKKCPKCAYVWLGYLAHFPKSLVDDIFGNNPFDDEDLLIHYKNMTGIDGHRSFECIGNIEECQLFMKKCLEIGLQGKMLDVFKKEMMHNDINWSSIEEKFNKVSRTHNIPAHFFETLKDLL